MSALNGPVHHICYLRYSLFNLGAREYLVQYLLFMHLVALVTGCTRVSIVFGQINVTFEYELIFNSIITDMPRYSFHVILFQ